MSPVNLLPFKMVLTLPVSIFPSMGFLPVVCEGSSKGFLSAWSGIEKSGSVPLFINTVSSLMVPLFL